MDEKLDWTQKLGDAFLDQQKELLDAVQRLRARAQTEGNLKSTTEQKVTVEPPRAAPPAARASRRRRPWWSGAAPPTVIKIEPANPQVVYVPSYNPTVVYGAWPYPAYPPYYPYPPGYAFGAAALSFGVGMAVGAAVWGNCNWGGGDVDVNVNKLPELLEEREPVGRRQSAHRSGLSRASRAIDRSGSTIRSIVRACSIATRRRSSATTAGRARRPPSPASSTAGAPTRAARISDEAAPAALAAPGAPSAEGLRGVHAHRRPAEVRPAEGGRRERFRA